MAKPAATVDEYLAALPADRCEAIRSVRDVVNRNLPEGYQEGIAYGMIGWCVPHSLFPAGYHCDPTKPLGYAALASQKSHMSLYLMSVYGSATERAWFEKAWAKSGKRLDMGKSCIRFKKVEDLPLDVIGQAIARVPVSKYVESYQRSQAARKPGRKLMSRNDR
jgi:hypothetical protein